MPARLRALGLLPLAFFSYSAALYVRAGGTHDLLWICNACNVLLGLGLLAGFAPLVRVSTLWLLLGTPLWIADSILLSGFSLNSFLTHVMSGAVGALALACLAPAKRDMWWLAVGLFALVQLASHHLTPAEHNVNAAHSVYAPLSPYFGNYWLYDLFNLASFGVLLFGIERLLSRFVEGRLRATAPGSAA